MTIWKSQVGIQRLKEAGAFFTGHFVLTGGKHSDFYIDCAQALRSSRLCEFFGSTIAHQLEDRGVEIDVIVTPAENAIPLGSYVANRLTKLYRYEREPRTVIASKGEDKSFVFKRGGDQEVDGKKVVVVEDLWSTGGSTKKVVELIRKHGGEVTAVAAIVNRGNVGSKDLGNPPVFFSLVSVAGIPFSENDCQLCKEAVPIDMDHGHGPAWLAKHPDYPVA
ncbi:hypothetical protein JXR01_02345 [Candidatus Kaiserbacteria bacterium]|nr:MAG: hypothetical protein JXR01_02345 [Candidatus Kaiserbacteria bacterium]